MSAHTYRFPGLNLADAGTLFVLKHGAADADTHTRGFFDLAPDAISTGEALFVFNDDIRMLLQRTPDSIDLTCTCHRNGKGLCSHQARVLLNVSKREELRIFFDDNLRHRRIREAAKAYGLEHVTDPDEHFEIFAKAKGFDIKPRNGALLPVTRETTSHVRKELAGKKKTAGAPHISAETDILVFRQHRYYKQFQVELAEVAFTRAGKIRNPVKLLDPLNFAWRSADVAEVRFFSAIARFRNNYEEEADGPDLDAIRQLVANPLRLAVYYHDAQAGEPLSAATLKPVKVKDLPVDVRLQVDRKEEFYEISSQVWIEDKSFDLAQLPLRYGCFVLVNGTLYFIGNEDLLRVAAWFRKRQNKIAIHESKFEEFRTEVLSGLEDRVSITWTYLKPATSAQLAESSFDAPPEKVLYLSDTATTVSFTPVMRYGPVEVAVGSLKQVFATDRAGNAFLVNRDAEEELSFIGKIVREHEFFKDQWSGESFYLHKKRMLDDDWFLDAYDHWTAQGITVLGFSAVTKNKLNPNKPTINIRVMSGLDWFDVWVEVFYGKQRVRLANLQRSVKNKSRFVKLDDGTQGILPEEWLEKFGGYFRAGDVADDTIRTPKTNFAAIAELYADEQLSEEVKLELADIRSRLETFGSIRDVAVPETLHAELRDYQKEGLNWLNFLHEFGFGGCLADDMGLGKTLQVIALLLHLKEQNLLSAASLIVVPTTLLSNWQSEVQRFAPSLRLRTLYANERETDTAALDAFDLILTSYGTLMSDIRFLKRYVFDYVVLDESQAIKNPDSMRYQAVMLLQAHHRLVLSGTPVENNTFDLYGQLSFACPGLLGDKTYFREIYAIPVDQFKDVKRAAELRKKIAPFILRRTKKQVATELPEKTEMVLYCEMEPEQKEVYDSYKREYRDYFRTHRENELPAHSIHILKGITLLRQICDSPSLLNEGPYYGQSSSKIRVLLDEIQAHASEHKILVFSQFTGMLDLVRDALHTHGIAFQYLTGQTTKRGEKIAAFRDDPSIRVFLISLKAGGTGLNLVEADYVYLLDPWWNPAVENQAIDRAHRIGQQKHVVAVRLICPGTIEEKMMLIQERKKELATGLVRTDGEIFKSLTRADLEELFT